MWRRELVDVCERPRKGCWNTRDARDLAFGFCACQRLVDDVIATFLFDRDLIVLDDLDFAQCPLRLLPRDVGCAENVYDLSLIADEAKGIGPR